MRIRIPFVVINTPAVAKIECEVAEDNRQVVFRFDAPFQIRDDIDVLRRMELNADTKDIVNAVVPPEFRNLVDAASVPLYAG